MDRGACPWLQSKGLQRVRHDLATECVRVRMCLRTHTHTPSPTPSPALSLFWIFRAGALQGIHEQSSAQGARVGVPQAACPGRCVCAHVCVCIVFACLYTHACVVMCAETHLCPQPLESRSPRPPSQDLRLCRSYRTKLLCGWEPTLTPPGASPAAPQMPGPAGSTRVPHRGWDVTGLPGDAHRLPLSETGGSGQLGAQSCTHSPSGQGGNRPPGGHTRAAPQWGCRLTCLTRSLSTGRPVNHRPHPRRPRKLPWFHFWTRSGTRVTRCRARHITTRPSTIQGGSVGRPWYREEKVAGRSGGP